ncbi:MAG: hypothetical protein KIT14_25765 [bacterium]|nr:hypothetical protein [bacterium]
MTRTLALVVALTLVPAAALAGLKRDCKLGCSTLLAVECGGLSTRKARKRCATARLSECRRAARAVARPSRGAAIAAFCAVPVTTTTVRLPSSTTTTTSTLPPIANVRGTWFLDASRVSDTCGLDQFFFTTSIRVTSQVGTNIAGNLGSGFVPWNGVILDDGWGGVTDVSCSGSCCAQSTFAVLGFAPVAAAALEFTASCGGFTCSATWRGTIERR